MTPIHEPLSEEAAARLVQVAALSRTPLAIRGGGTRGLAAAPDGAETLSTRGLAGIVAYNPAEMTMTARAGTPLEVVEAALAEKRQMLAFEPCDLRGALGSSGIPTIGGVFATNASGPRRFVAGAARDSLLGVRFVNGRGEVVKAGGRVMKNVTGLDLVKLLAGSHGALALMTEVTFRLLPVPETATTIVVSGLNDAEAAAAMATAMAMSVEVSGAAHLPESVRGRFAGGALPDGTATVLRLEGLAASVAVRSQKLAASMARFGAVTHLDAETTARLWREIRDVAPYADGTPRPLWRVSIAPTAGHQLVAALRLEAGVDAFYDWQGGLVWLRMEADPEAALLRRYVKAVGGGHATLLRARPEVLAATAVFEPQAEAVAALSARVKASFDPAGLFVSRMVG
ncbi:FAD-binding protein [Shinella yambaruensis]|uniref:2-hydroxy-acid oxidase n=1 Tax=Shinella yambaruensis TaxID=415996 RepID=A0ABQ5ZGA0_9HYPH|nr:FAD-binding protein [Shinella yambaruensis]MCJ8026536.1 FAD-binding protein [Shinella yambaruensis]MCU7982330.1 FAD-binding protein [Shinella yambaruensis]GLR51850.1 2-hydroxy-acid oxidase [Shinella yambaruensis]